MSIVFSHGTALNIFRWRPDLLSRPREPLPSATSPLPPSSRHAAALFEAVKSKGSEFHAGDAGVASNHVGRLGDCAASGGPHACAIAPMHCMTGEGWTRYSPHGVVTHSGARDFATRSFIEIEDGVYAVCPELAFVQCCRGLSPIESLLLGFELTGTYSTMRTFSCSCSNLSSLSTKRKIVGYLGRNRGVYGAGKLMEAGLLGYLRDGSASFQETRLAMVLGLPVRMGGRGLGMPAMNYRIDVAGKAARIAGRQYLLADLCWPKVRIDVEYESRRHHSDPEERISDFKRVHALELSDWKVIQVSEVDIRSSVTLDAIAELIRKRAGSHKRKLTAVQIRKQRNLERLLAMEGVRF